MCVMQIDECVSHVLEIDLTKEFMFWLGLYFSYILSMKLYLDLDEIKGYVVQHLVWLD